MKKRKYIKLRILYYIMSITINQRKVEFLTFQRNQKIDEFLNYANLITQNKSSAINQLRHKSYDEIINFLSIFTQEFCVKVLNFKLIQLRKEALIFNQLLQIAKNF